MKNMKYKINDCNVVLDLKTRGTNLGIIIFG